MLNKSHLHKVYQQYGRSVDPEMEEMCKKLVMEERIMRLLKGMTISKVKKGTKVSPKFFKLTEDRTEILYKSSLTKPFQTAVKLADIAGFGIGEESGMVKTKKVDDNMIKLSFSLLDSEGNSLLCFSTKNRKEFYMLLDSFRYLLGKEVEEVETKKEIEDMIEIISYKNNIEKGVQGWEKSPVIPPRPKPWVKGTSDVSKMHAWNRRSVPLRPGGRN